MKRCLALQELSKQHHHGLVLAKHATEAAGAEAEKEVWGEIRERFAAELEPHFQVEERLLLPALERAGEHGLVRCTLEDHANLRCLISEGGTQAMTQLAALLERHIRFEERELFEVAQQKLQPEELDALADSMDKPGICRTR